MAAEFETNAGNTTVRMEWTALTTKIQNVVGNAAKILYERQADESDPSFDTLSNQDKLDIVYQHCKDVMIALARDEYVNSAAETAKEDASSTFVSEHDLG